MEEQQGAGGWAWRSSREQAGGRGGAADVRAEGNEGGVAAVSRAREGRAQLRVGARRWLIWRRSGRG